MPAPTGPFDEVMDDMFGRQPAFDFMNLGAASAVHAYTGSESLTRPLIANFVWQSFLGHPIGFEGLVSMVTQLHPNFSVRRIQVIWHGSNRGVPRSDLLILGRGLRNPTDDTLSTEMSLTPDEAMHGWREFAARQLEGQDEEALAPHKAMFSRFDPAEIARQACSSLLTAQPFKVLVMEAPAMETTSLLPARPIEVANRDSGEISTAGVIAHRGSERGVTAALHAVQDSGTVTIDGARAHIRSQDVLSDSAFLVPDDPSKLTGVAASPLVGLVPRMFESVSFNGVKSGPTPGQIKGIDPRLPFVSSKAQLAVTTDLITAKGDSGAALIDSGGKVLGFAHERTLASAPNPHSSWIWAELVFALHGLT